MWQRAHHQNIQRTQESSHQTPNNAIKNRERAVNRDFQIEENKVAERHLKKCL